MEKGVIVARKKGVVPETTLASSAQLAVAIVVNPTDDTPSFYSNYAEVSFNQHEIRIFFVKTPTKLDSQRLEEAKSGRLVLDPMAQVLSGRLVLDPMAQVLIAPTLLPGLIRALQVARDEYEKAFGVIREGGVDAK
jgi:hypothetical protein